MQPRIETIGPKKLIGKRLTMCYGNNKTFELWRSFMPHRSEIENKLGADLISMQVYSTAFDFKTFNPHAEFEKWAAVEVVNYDNVPEGMETYTMPGGLYAVFIHKGPVSDAPKTFSYIFGTWLPNSAYVLDKRPHFEVLGEKFNKDSADSEEEIWIPVKAKNE